MVKTLNNPQPSMDYNYSGKKIDYIFEHIPPGNYTVFAEFFQGNESVNVEVGSHPMRADIVLSDALNQPYGWSDVPFTPTVSEFLASDTRQAPALPGLLVVVLMGIVAYFMRKNNKY